VTCIQPAQNLAVELESIPVVPWQSDCTYVPATSTNQVQAYMLQVFSSDIYWFINHRGVSNLGA
jgi:hypothetical protein